MQTRRYSSRPALRLTGRYIPFGGESVVHGYADTGELKAVSRKMGVSITKYLTACLIWSISRVYEEEGRKGRHIGVNLPIKKIVKEKLEETISYNVSN